jgi:hypothetical protein
MTISQEIYQSLTQTSIEDFFKAFSTFEKEAFRLEMLDKYLVDEESQAFEDFRKGQKKPPVDYNHGWCEFIADALRKGKRFNRVRVASEPYSDYFLFELNWAYTKNIQAGENISLMTKEDLKHCLEDISLLQDFWLFDEEYCLIMDYDILGNFLGVKQLDKKYIDQYIDLKERVKLRAHDITESKIWKMELLQ